MGLALVVLVGLVACETERESPQSQAVKEPRTLVNDSISVPLGNDAEKPTSVAQLQQRLPELEQIKETEMQAVVASLNLVPSPCASCKGRTAAHCLVELGWTECRVLSKLANRAVRLAKKGQSVDEIKIAINYPDQWFPGMGEGTPVQVHLYRDLGGRFSRQTEEIRGRVSEIFGDKVEVVTHDDLKENVGNLDIRSRPTWFVNGHRFRGVQSVNGIARFISYELDD